MCHVQAVHRAVGVSGAWSLRLNLHVQGLRLTAEGFIEEG